VNKNESVTEANVQQLTKAISALQAYN